ncbi:MAG: relaxase/mobilization nuclease domain-containing protein [Hyphomicrobiaceae bacterium]
MPPHNDFHALARYLILGKSGKGSPDRVAWTFAHNLPTDDPLLAATYMQATAEKSRRCKNAAYHTIISWAEHERPSPDIMQEIAHKTLDLAGLANHQALVMGHGDRPHRHLHMMINRVSLDTGKAWSTSHDFKRFDAIMQQLSESYGFQYVPAHTYNPDLTADLSKKPNSRSTYAAKRGANTNRLQWSRRQSQHFAERLSERLDQASTFDDVVEALTENGLTVEKKGKGYVAGNRSSYVKLSALGLSPASKPTGKARTGRRRRSGAQPPTGRHKRRSIFEVDAVDIARAIGTRADVREAINQSKALRNARIARLPLMQRLMAELKDYWKRTTALELSKPKRPHKFRKPKRATPQRGRTTRC